MADIIQSFVGTWALSGQKTINPISRECENRRWLEIYTKALASNVPFILSLALQKGQVTEYYLSGHLTADGFETKKVYAIHFSPEPEIDGTFGEDEVDFYATRSGNRITVLIDGTPPDHPGERVIVHQCWFDRVRQVPPNAPPRRTTTSTTASRKVHDMAPDLYMQCGICSGSGKVQCSSCGGTGGRTEETIDYDFENNPIYSTRWVSCSCGGNGSICGNCGGSGSISR